MRKFLHLIIFIVSIHYSNGQAIIVPSQTANPTSTFHLEKTPSALGISAEVLAKTAALENPPLNIALFGVDRRNKDTYGNADMIVIISIDQLTKKIKLASILRDTYVNISGRGKDKINAAFAEGGPQLAIKTINENFSLDISEYVSLDFFGSARIIDALGGVTLNVKKEEIPYLNNYLGEIAAIEMGDPVKLTKPGLQKLNGRQAVAYSRIRAVGNDYERTARQRNVMASLLERLQNIDPETFPSLALQILPDLQTSISPMKLYSIGSGLLTSKNKLFEPARFPLDSDSKGITINGIWYLSADLKKTTNALHNFIYKSIPPEG